MKAFLRHNAWIIGALAFAALIVGAAIALTGIPRNPMGQGASVPAHASLQDYTWDELAAISEEIAGCENEGDAIACAHAFGLCQDDGGLDGSQTREIELADARRVKVVLAGIWHDERTDGGKAGLTFAFADAAEEHAMNHAFEDPLGRDADSKGGWESSDMRSWLEGSFYYALPADLRSRIVSVQKRTANGIDLLDELDDAGRVAGTASDWVGETSDKLWLFSASELCGNVPVRADLDVDSTMSLIYSAEGEQYRLFADAEVAAFAPNRTLVRHPAGTSDDARQPTTWWLRTKTLEFGDGFWLIGTDGTPLNGLGEDARVALDPSYAPYKLWGPDHARGTVVGFCL